MGSWHTVVVFNSAAKYQNLTLCELYQSLNYFIRMNFWSRENIIYVKPESRTLQLSEFTHIQIFEGGFVFEMSPRVTESVDIINNITVLEKSIF